MTALEEDAMLAHDPAGDDCDPGGLVCSNPYHLVTAVTDALREGAS